LNSWPSHVLTHVSLQVPSSWVLAEGKTLIVFVVDVHYIIYHRTL
jgi:hypothetical protein